MRACTCMQRVCGLHACSCVGTCVVVCMLARGCVFSSVRVLTCACVEIRTREGAFIYVCVWIFPCMCVSFHPKRFHTRACVSKRLCGPQCTLPYRDQRKPLHSPDKPIIFVSFLQLQAPLPSTSGCTFARVESS